MNGSRIACLVALAWLGTQGCVFGKDDGCAEDADCESSQICNEGECVGAEPGDEPSGETGGSEGGGKGGSGSQTVPACTTETEVERIQKFASHVAAPAECETDLLDGDYVGNIAPWDSAYEGEGRNVVVAKIDGLTLTSLDGVPCEPVWPGEVTNSKAFGSEELECEQYYACGCCSVEFKRHPLGLPEQEPLRDVWSIKKSGTQCHIGIKNAEYFFNIDFEDAPKPNPEPPRPSGDACDDCLSACSGLPSCCTGSGCACEASCRPTSCAAGTTYCCGPYGGCFCTSSCPY